MQISDEDLIAYVLGEASPELTIQIEQRLSTDLRLFERVSRLREVLGQIHQDGCYEPPGDLIESTLRRIDSEAFCPEPVTAEERNTGFGDVPGDVSPIGTRVCLPPVLSGASTGGFRRLSDFSRYDSFVLSLSLIVLCALVLPAIVRVRFEARKNQCANNLRPTGYALIDYAINDPQGRLPYVGIDQRTGFAGVYAVHLTSFGESIPYSQLQCPSLYGCDRAQPAIIIDAIPTFEELGEIALSELALWQSVIGGHYAYNLGVVEDNRVVAPKYEGRSHFAILSDAPVFVEASEEYIAHDGVGLNILYEDGRIDFVETPAVDSYGLPVDHPFRNLSGIHAVGLNVSDAALAPSYFSPLGR